MESFSDIESIELLAIDGGSSDGTPDFLLDQGFQVCSLPASSRAARLRRGLVLAKGDVVLFHHPRSYLNPKAIQWLLTQYSESYWGGFQHRFDSSHWLLKFTSWYSNNVRPRKGILYLDHCIFFPKSAIADPMEIPDVEVFEDTEISKILYSRLGRPRVLPYSSTTSSIRFQANGVIRQALLNQKLKIKYYFGSSHKKMNEDYEKGLDLNNK